MNKKIWSEEEVKYLIENYKKYFIRELSLMMDRSILGKIDDGYTDDGIELL